MKDAVGQVHGEGKIGSTRRELDAWVRTLPEPRMIAMEATIFTGWIYDHLLPCRAGEGRAPADAAGDRRSQAEERQDRCREDRGLPEVRLPARVPPGPDGDPGPAAGTALPEPGAATGGADEEPDLRSSDGDRGELQQAAPARRRPALTGRGL